MRKQENITEPDAKGYQVRVVRLGKEYSRYFSYKKHSGKRKALQAAIEWRDEIRAKHNKKAQRATRSNTGVRGVSRTVKHDSRRDTTYVSYSAHFKNEDGTPNNKTFYVGNINNINEQDELKAFRAAKRFRKQFEKQVQM